jgi:hypothetical protein
MKQDGAERERGDLDRVPKRVDSGRPSLPGLERFSLASLQRSASNRAVAGLLRRTATARSSKPSHPLQRCSDHPCEGDCQYAETPPSSSSASSSAQTNDGHVIQRVPDENGVKAGRYDFSANCGWIDWGHADPSLANALIARIRQASDALRTTGAGTSGSTGGFSSPAMTSTAPGGSYCPAPPSK